MLPIDLLIYHHQDIQTYFECCILLEATDNTEGICRSGFLTKETVPFQVQTCESAALLTAKLLKCPEVVQHSLSERSDDVTLTRLQNRVSPSFSLKSPFSPSSLKFAATDYYLKPAISDFIMRNAAMETTIDIILTEDTQNNAHSALKQLDEE